MLVLPGQEKNIRGKQGMTVEKNINKRWIDGVAHHERSIDAYNAIRYLDMINENRFDFRSGGDGDNGEVLMYLMDMYFEAEEKGEDVREGYITNCVLCYSSKVGIVRRRSLAMMHGETICYEEEFYKCSKCAKEWTDGSQDIVNRERREKAYELAMREEKVKG